MSNIARMFVMVAALAALAGCAADPGIRGYWTLHPSDFERLKPGTTKAEVERAVGKPIALATFPNLQEEVWDYRCLGGGLLHKYVSVHFDPSGAMKYATIRPDPAYRGR